MICSKCGAKLEEGHLFCLKCGHEVQIVPDYNPMEELVVKNLAEAQKYDWSDTCEFSFCKDITKEMLRKNTASNNPKNLSDTIPFSMEEMEKAGLSIERKGNQNNSQSSKVINHDSKSEISKPKEWFSHNKRRIQFITAIIFLILIIFTITFNVIRVRQDNSITYQVTTAKELIANNNYKDAKGYLEHALILDSQSTDVRFLLVTVYEKLNDTYAEALMLNEIIQIDSENKTAYEKLIQLYMANNRKADLAILLDKLSQTKIASDFAQYFVPVPTFSEAEGSYDHAIEIRIDGQENQTIYYTTDGSDATVHSTKYEKPFKLDQGTTTVHAITVSESGQPSIQCKATYTITAVVPVAPTASISSGSYVGPIQVSLTAEDGATIYYSLDGSDPVESGSIYQAPITLEVGEYNLNATAVSSSNISSELASYQYSISVTAQVAKTDAYNRLVNDMGLSDDQGSYQFIYKTTTLIDESYYYIFDKIYDNNSGANSMVAVDINSAYHCPALSDGANGYVLNR